MLTDTACRNLKARNTPYKKSDRGGLFLFIKPNGNKLWRMAYRFGGKQKLLALGAYPTITLAEAREARDNAKKLLANGIDPAVAKREAKREQAAARTFGDWADEWVEKERSEHDEKTMVGKDRFVGYLKAEFGDRMIPAITRAEVLLYLRSYEKAGRLETRDRVRSTGASYLRLRRRER